MATTASTHPRLTTGHADFAALLEHVGSIVLRYSLVFLLLFFGALKWTSAEAHAIEPFVANSPLFAWMIPLLGLQGVSIFVGVIELTIGAMIALRPWAPRLTALGSLVAIGMFLTTLSFLVTTPNVGEA